MGRRVQIVMTDVESRCLKCKVGDRFFGELSDGPDWQIGCYEVTLSNEDALIVGEGSVSLGWQCELVEPNV